jgi:hypothetical protein
VKLLTLKGNPANKLCPVCKGQKKFLGMGGITSVFCKSCNGTGTTVAHTHPAETILQKSVPPLSPPSISSLSVKPVDQGDGNDKKKKTRR